MLGAIIGDVVGSIYEVEEVKALKESALKRRSYVDRIKILNKDIPLFTKDSSYTDDTVLTVAIIDAIMNDKNYETYLRKYGLSELSLGVDKYGRSRFGSGFISWLKNNYRGNSYGNGAAMRISPIGYYYNSLEEISEECIKATIPSHNHIDAIKGANAICDCIFLSRNGNSKEKIKEFIEEKYNYNLNYNLENLQRNNKFSSKALITVPQAIYVFLVSNDFEDSIRKAISIGGDSDTIACMTGSISEAYYGIPNNLKELVLPYIPNYMKDVIKKFYDKINLEKEKGYQLCKK